MKDNVIDFEQRRAKKIDSEKLKSLKGKAEIENVKLVVSTSLLSVLILATLANSNMLSGSHSETTQSRGVASVQTGTSAWEDRLAEKLASTSLKQEAEIGRTPSSTEQFTFGALEGKYAVRFENGKVRELEFANPQSEQHPIIVVDRAAFLKSYGSVLPVQFEKVEKVDSTQESAQTLEHYNLLDANGHFVGAVEFTLDSTNRLLSMRYLDSRLAAN